MIETLIALFISKPAPVVVPAPQTYKEERVLEWDKLTHPQRVWIMALENCESSGKNVSIIDSNGLPSTGHYQFQSALWIDQSKKLGVYNGSPTAADYPYEIQRDVAAFAVYEKGLSKRWTCTRKIGSPPIKKTT